ncbi:SDR family oxidoreductase [bacterium]|nr:SDR family oxidoreductase [bacterium]
MKENSLIGYCGIVAGFDTEFGMGMVNELNNYGVKVTSLGRITEKNFWRRAPRRRGIEAVLNYTTCDFKSPGAIRNIVRGHMGYFGRLDFVVYGSSADFLCPLENMSQNGFSQALQTGVVGAFSLFQECLPFFRQTGGGRVIGLGHHMMKSHFQYAAQMAASKTALYELIKSVAVEWGQYQVTANMISPGPIETESGSLFRMTPGSQRKKMLRTSSPAGRFTSSKEVGGLIAYLLSPQARMITGQNIVIDGGLSLNGVSTLPPEDRSSGDPRRHVVTADDVPLIDIEEEL